MVYSLNHFTQPPRLTGLPAPSGRTLLRGIQEAQSGSRTAQAQLDHLTNLAG